MRRVVGLTQGDGPYLVGSDAAHNSWVWFDKSRVDGLKFSEGKIARNLGITKQYVNWPEGLIDINGNATNVAIRNVNKDFMAPDTEISEIDSPRVTSWIIDFVPPESTPRTNTGAYTTGFRQEHIRVRLGENSGPTAKAR